MAGVLCNPSAESGIPTDDLRWLPEGAQERPPHALAVGKAGFGGDLVDGMAALLHHHAGGLHPQVFDGLGGRLPGFGAEGTAELAGAEMGDLGEIFNRQLGLEILLGVREDILNAVGFGGYLQQCRVLRLPAGAAVIDDKLPGHHSGNIGAHVFFDHAEGQIDAGAGARRGPDRCRTRSDGGIALRVQGELEPPHGRAFGWAYCTSMEEAEANVEFIVSE